MFTAWPGKGDVKTLKGKATFKTTCLDLIVALPLLSKYIGEKAHNAPKVKL